MGATGERRKVRELDWVRSRPEAWAYVVSFVATPVAFTVAVRMTPDLAHSAYGLLIWASAMPIWLLVSERAHDYGRSAYSLWGLRGQLWLHFGGGLRQALRCLRGRRVPVESP